ncbi:MAG: tetratricopeptide repeat protein [Bacteroidia bacterium]|nr:tetratricopeptide repeat protein [Bacteroidia bacterium]
MKKPTLILAMITFMVSVCQAQLTKKEQKGIEKSIKMYEKKKYEKAINLIEPVVRTYPYSGQLWRNLIEYSYQDYLANGRLVMPGFTVTFEPSGDEEADAESEGLIQQLNALMSMSGQKRQLRFAIREATRYASDEYLGQGDLILRSTFIDTRYPVDTNITTKAKEYYMEAEASFGSRDYNKAADLYNKALGEDPSFYKAALYRGDSYYLLKEYERAAPIFKEAADRFPDLLEPQKYYVDALMNMGEWEKAKDATVEGILRYPGIGMFSRLSSCADNLEKDFDRKWVPRECEVNRMEDRSKYFNASPDTVYPEYWNYYKEALEEVKKFSNKEGVLEKNSVTDYFTIEAYAWDYMLEKADDGIEALEVARQMKEKGQLEPYVLISLFHYDLYDQYKFYVTQKKDEATAYINSLIE